MFNNSHRENCVLLISVQEFIAIEALAASDLFLMLIQSVGFYTFHCHILKSKPT